MIPRTLLTRAARTTTTRRLHLLAIPLSRPSTVFPLQARLASHTPPLTRLAHTHATADAAIEEITELFATAKDEFEIAMEETEKNTTYAPDDRAAAREELEKVKEAYRSVVEGPDREVAEEVKRRVGQRIRELEQGVTAMEELAMNQD